MVFVSILFVSIYFVSICFVSIVCIDFLALKDEKYIISAMIACAMGIYPDNESGNGNGFMSMDPRKTLIFMEILGAVTFKRTSL